ncbi:hypothetical protein IW261DRAFT_1556809 [Armillaria novae-zelandiae]|uniref:Uncharacterized protein n=1 Tax=Armillaria novae-zelandiae TaxID=153914 RepID=A0AA39UPE6_9AGAR|nr:hypothetical protein IW261DRAFT_1556809 [Armillaria novae-zelandiae]
MTGPINQLPSTGNINETAHYELAFVNGVTTDPPPEVGNSFVIVPSVLCPDPHSHQQHKPDGSIIGRSQLSLTSTRHRYPELRYREREKIWMGIEPPVLIIRSPQRVYLQSIQIGEL